jgi:hypothetical protein
MLEILSVLVKFNPTETSPAIANHRQEGCYDVDWVAVACGYLPAIVKRERPREIE